MLLFIKVSSDSTPVVNGAELIEFTIRAHVFYDKRESLPDGSDVLVFITGLVWRDVSPPSLLLLFRCTISLHGPCISAVFRCSPRRPSSDRARRPGY